MFFALHPIPGTSLHGLLCSDIISTLDTTTLFMPLVVYCLLGAGARDITVPLPQSINIPSPRMSPPLGRTRFATQQLKQVSSTCSSSSEQMLSEVNQSRF